MFDLKLVTRVRLRVGLLLGAAVSLEVLEHGDAHHV
jgi:hypothetical protein